MDLPDPDDLNGDGSTTFTLPYVTIENVLVLNAHTLLVATTTTFPMAAGGRWQRTTPSSCESRCRSG